MKRGIAAAACAALLVGALIGCTQVEMDELAGAWRLLGDAGGQTYTIGGGSIVRSDGAAAGFVRSASNEVQIVGGEKVGLVSETYWVSLAGELLTLDSTRSARYVFQRV